MWKRTGSVPRLVKASMPLVALAVSVSVMGATSTELACAAVPNSTLPASARTKTRLLMLRPS
jgi:hypothetical protein